jgi:hypothetical protein
LFNKHVIENDLANFSKELDNSFGKLESKLEMFLNVIKNNKTP